jgi:hypothetical protein
LKRSTGKGGPVTRDNNNNNNNNIIIIIIIIICRLFPVGIQGVLEFVDRVAIL